VVRLEENTQTHMAQVMMEDDRIADR